MASRPCMSLRMTLVSLLLMLQGSSPFAICLSKHLQNFVCKAA